MKNNNPRGKTPSLIGSTNGRPKRVDVKKRSECKRCKADILAGQDCFGIPKVGGAFSSVKRFCKTCYENIIKQTQSDLEELKIL